MREEGIDDIYHVFHFLFFLDVALLEYFRSIFDHDDVLEATVALDLYGLEKKIENRDRVLQKLEVIFFNDLLVT